MLLHEQIKYVIPLLSIWLLEKASSMGSAMRLLGGELGNLLWVLFLLLMMSPVLGGTTVVKLDCHRSMWEEGFKVYKILVWLASEIVRAFCRIFWLFNSAILDLSLPLYQIALTLSQHVWFVFWSWGAYVFVLEFPVWPPFCRFYKNSTDKTWFTVSKILGRLLASCGLSVVVLDL